MNVRWLLGNFTDPQYNLSRRDQFRLSKVAHREHLSAWALLVRMVVIVVPPLAGMGMVGPALEVVGLGGSTPAHTWALGMIALGCWPWSAWMFRSLYAEPVRRAMRAEGYDVCIGCGYGLGDLPAEVACCPECGRGREPSSSRKSGPGRASPTP